MSSSIWDWVAVILGLRSGDGLFMPLYWYAPVRALFLPLGWVPTPTALLWTWVVLSLALCGLYLWRRRNAYMVCACAIWGLLFADTPYVALIPPLVWFGWTQGVRLVCRLRHVDVLPRLHVRFRLFISVFVACAVLAGLVNLSFFGLTYVVGYLRYAYEALRPDGGWHPVACARMDRILDEYVRELVREADGRAWIFTDGLCDTGIELASGGKLRALSLTSEIGSDVSRRVVWRQRGFSKWEDLYALQGGTHGLMRSWVIDRPENLSNVVFQSGFTFLDREGKGRLTHYGLVMRTDERGKDEADAAARRLGEQIVEFYDLGHLPGQGGHIRSARFCLMQWRVARAIRRHAAELDCQKRTQEAVFETELSELLDKYNPMARQTTDTMRLLDLRAFGPITAREGLVFALSRANFALARNYARVILKDEPENAEANFAMAMSHLQIKEYSQAKYFFNRALDVRPDDPTLLNNLALAEMEQGELDAAERHANAALKAKPDSDAIRDTLRQIERRRKSGE